MKKHLFSLAMAIVMMFSLSITSFAAEAPVSDEFYVVGHVLTQEETAEFWQLHAQKARVSMASTIYLPRNVNGTQGNGTNRFTADSSTVSFVITNAPNTATYNVVLKNSYGNAVSIYYKDIPINNPIACRGLIVGETYYFEVSSNDCPASGCTANYEIY